MLFSPITERIPPASKSGAHLVGSAALAVLLVLGMFLASCRGRGHDQPQAIMLTGTALAEFTSLEPIDAHTHVSQSGPAFLGMLDQLHIHLLDILYVDDTDQSRAAMQPQKADALKFIASTKGRATLCTTFDPFQFNDKDFPKQTIDALNQDFADGAVAAKIWKNVGLELRNASGQYVMPDDLRLEPIYQDIAAHHKTLVAHLAEPDAAWGAKDTKSPDRTYYAAHPEWDMSKKPDAPAKATILDARDHMLAMNPDLRVVGAHLGSMEDDLDALAERLDRYPNFAVDTAARVLYLANQPRDKVRAFFMKYQDRILYGTDLRFESASKDQAAAYAWEAKYALDWRYFSTSDKFDFKGRRVEGLGLPKSVLQKLYHENAVRWIPGIEGGAH
jgi:predicted TIM-barrel fold metal-dependent hydrolase